VQIIRGFSNMVRPKFGDIIEIKTSKGLAYALYTHRNKQYGALLRVFGHILPSRPSHFDTLVSGRPQFETFFPLGAAVHRGIVSVVGSVPIPPQFQAFPIFRSGSADPITKKVKTWWLWDGEKEWLVGNITDEQRKLPIRGVWNDTLLRERIDTGWTAENDYR